MTPRQSGFSLIEVLVTIAILMIGLLGLAALQTNATIAEMEAYQRSQALVLVQDMADRIAANKANADSYKRVDIGLTPPAPCGATPGADLDLCEWNNKLAGAAEVTAGGGRTGAMIGARGCITEPTPNVYMITVAWQGFSVAGIPANTCGQNAYGAGTLDGQRRTVSTIVRVGLLGFI
jgi:type IV pilus assembly protein PilV